MIKGSTHDSLRGIHHIKQPFAKTCAGECRKSVTTKAAELFFVEHLAEHAARPVIREPVFLSGAPDAGCFQRTNGSNK